MFKSLLDSDVPQVDHDDHVVHIFEDKLHVVGVRGGGEMMITFPLRGIIVEVYQSGAKGLFPAHKTTKGQPSNFLLREINDRNFKKEKIKKVRHWTLSRKISKVKNFVC